MGRTAAELLVKRIQTPDDPYPHDIAFEPELIIRESTMAVPKTASLKKQQRKR
jgi:LacI family transcriptional regulator